MFKHKEKSYICHSRCHNISGNLNNSRYLMLYNSFNIWGIVTANLPTICLPGQLVHGRDRRHFYITCYCVSPSKNVYWRLNWPKKIFFYCCKPKTWIKLWNCGVGFFLNLFDGQKPLNEAGFAHAICVMKSDDLYIYIYPWPNTKKKNKAKAICANLLFFSWQIQFYKGQIW